MNYFCQLNTPTKDNATHYSVRRPLYAAVRSQLINKLATLIRSNVGAVVAMDASAIPTILNQNSTDFALLVRLCVFSLREAMNDTFII